jgi:hypothetical protein
VWHTNVGILTQAFNREARLSPSMKMETKRDNPRTLIRVIRSLILADSTAKPLRQKKNRNPLWNARPSCITPRSSIVNRTKKPIRLRVIDHQQKYIGRDQFLPTEIAAGDSLGGNQYKNVDQFGNHLGHLEFELSAKKENWLKGVSLVTESPDCIPVDDIHRKCFYSIVRTSKPFY